ncbi:MAG: ester cyclase [Kofleriaceae bacterium]|nr:ester cyclase [Kofleriaceae bacterium]
MTLSIATVAPRLIAGLGFALGACTDVPTASAPVVEARIDLIHQRIAANNTRDWPAWEALHTPGAVRTAPELSAPLVGAPAMRAGIEELVLAFPDYHLELVEAFGTGDRLMARIHTRATMLGPLDINGVAVPPTGRMFEQDWVAVLTFEGNLISAIDEFHDNYDILVQLGLAQ